MMIHPTTIATIQAELAALREQLAALTAALEGHASRRQTRIALGDAGIITLDEAANRLPIGDAEGRKWLRSRGLVRDLLGRDVVRWRDVLDALAGESAPEPPRAANVATLPRAGLRRRSR